MTRHPAHPKSYLICTEQRLLTAGTRLMRPSDNNINFTTTFGYPGGRSSSLTGMHCAAEITGHTSNGVVTIDCLVNNSVVFTAVSATVTGVGVVYFQFLQRPGIDLFAHPDFLTTQLTLTASTIEVTDILAVVEVELDS